MSEGTFLNFQNHCKKLSKSSDAVNLTPFFSSVTIDQLFMVVQLFQ